MYLLSYLLRQTPNDDTIPLRVYLTSDNALSLKVHMYREIEDPKTGDVS